MCGICGISVGRERVDARAAAEALLLGIAERGQDATGVAWWDRGGVRVHKAAVPAAAFARRLAVPARARALIGHTRWATQGSPRNPRNNHPIDVGRIVGVHNGVLANDDALFDRIGPARRAAQVDSEAIFAWLQHRRDRDGALADLRGSAAVAWLDRADRGAIHLARASYSPLVVAPTAGGSLLFGSTERCVRSAAAALGLDLGAPESIPEGTALVVRDGRVESRAAFRTPARAALSEVERRALQVA